jgi:large subunit ribosomal protein L10
MEHDRKREIVTSLKEELGQVSSVFLCNFNGLTVEKDTQLRRKLRENGAKYAVIKNTLLKLAFADTDLAQVSDHLVGNTAVAHNDKDVVGLAKAIRDFAKDKQAFKLKSGVVEGRVISVNDLDALATMPSKEELVSKLMYMLNFPIQGFATALAGVSRKFVVVLDQIKQQKENN